MNDKKSNKDTSSAALYGRSQRSEGPDKRPLTLKTAAPSRLLAYGMTATQVRKGRKLRLGFFSSF